MPVFYLHRTLGFLLDRGMAPFASLDPLWPLTFFSLIVALLMLWVFRHTSDQERMRQVKNRIKAHLLEMRLFRDEWRLLLQAQKNIVRYNLQYLRCTLRPFLVLLLPLFLLLVHLHEWFGYRPLRPGEAAIVTVQVEEQGRGALREVRLEAGPGLSIETPPLRIPARGEVSWRVRALSPGEHAIVVHVGNGHFRKRIRVAEGELARIEPLLGNLNFWDSLLYPQMERVASSSRIRRIAVGYPSRRLEVFSWEVHWLLPFLVLSLGLGFALKGWFGVEI